ncbi:ASCH domain-containing protein [uncultured Flavobacterium sp.]|uniref:ASCH domain-containing protein n=1 Tax=uncultured Flavobacterium sp. TaxID=165435 RepID=UPI0030ED8386|tara:strand:+ start:22909 stop:23577 length:669 start_codon:yes stop_codon:yes gene_type:complete
MKALSIKQPWASLIAHGIKDIENRTWKTHFRGRIYIHASAKDFGSLSQALNQQQWDKTIQNWNSDYFPDRPLSAIIGEVDIIDCVINHPSIWAESSGNQIIYSKPKIENYYIGGNFVDYNHSAFNMDLELWKNQKPIYNWVLANPVLYDKPILNVKGKLSFWEWNGCEQTCESCQKDFDMDTMQRDSDDNYFCKLCADELFPTMKKEYDEMVAKGEIEPNNH